ncbi:hypothetical protein Glove_83g12 [Diversispora epigaea]|uniref:Uncharacterized protein n=1 Tax=Diversispora epigaea TaxID=1348612 RepID=A0A397JEG7_9GLOM|nr:hypothetical protein Glove_83g12 [Diversispora epigaea]
MCLNKIVGQTEITGPQVSAYLLGFKDHYTPNKFVLIYLNSFEAYLTSQYPIRNLPESIISENSDTSSDEDKLDLENSSEYNQTNDEMFTVINFGKRIGAVNLRIDYMYRGEQLENMCLYDYVSTVHKIKINEKELNKLSRQKNREGRATKVDCFLFLGGEKKCNENCDHSIIHPQHSTHIQIHWSRENDKIPVLCEKGVPPRNDLKNIERYGLCILLLFKPWTTADNLMEETVLDRRLRQVARENPEIAKIR